ncbi:hypothetical protein VOLCADRAFT_98396 [Volvox carteri f. nagariensis]|uniref:HAT C-terminal dimerisation domain-containing protein n=1 Tax=Volvox carteri f. nagariensis TaxID=3068 RepID=D8UF85_VOLCA|nr:uncharacterized protein VOLCADRAFT_98396 [Volvox carteri f. nagariensis]EFJ41638.1 hypothetical protein VOLCADRAFT_98396 [Volvox carteri f. nagariensis]|eukprot:XP_002957294.1 hypothetical protein VOLCADRAFT_98396 [Volvox carteri f. nagariensis]
MPPYRDIYANSKKYATLMQPVSDAIHQFEGDRPSIGQVLKVQRALDAHFAEFDKQNPDMMVKPRGNKEAVGVQSVYEQRRGSTLSNVLVPLAHALDPINFVQLNGGDNWFPPFHELSKEERKDARKLAAEVYAGNGEGATEEDRRADKEMLSEWGTLALMGVPDDCKEHMEVLTARKTVESKAGNSTTVSVQIAGIEARLMFWSQHMSVQYPALANVADRVLRMHTTTCAAERNWSLWGNIFSKARNRLAQERAEKLIYIRQNDDSNKGKGSRLSDEEVVMTLLAAEDEKSARV